MWASSRHCCLGLNPQHLRQVFKKLVYISSFGALMLSPVFCNSKNSNSHLNAILKLPTLASVCPVLWPGHSCFLPFEMSVLSESEFAWPSWWPGDKPTKTTQSDITGLSA